MAKIIIEDSKFIEAVCEIAELVVEHSSNLDDDKYIIKNGVTMYTDEAQKLFDQSYDEIERIINRDLKVYQYEQ